MPTMTLRILTTLACAMLAQGCTLAPPYQRPDATPAAYPTGPAYPALPAAGLAAADTGWASFLSDQRLRTLVRIALDNNQDLRLALLRVAHSRAVLESQRAAAWPELGLGVSGTHAGSPADGDARVRKHGYSAGIRASWELDLFGRLRNMAEAAQEQYLASANGRQAMHILLVSEVAEQYLALLSYGEQLEAARATLEAARESYRIVSLRYDTGAASELDATLAQGTVDQALASHAAKQRLRAQAENGLVVLIGQPLPAALPPARSLSEQDFLADIPPGLPSELLLRRPDVRQAEALLRAQYANIGAARAAFFPRISLTAVAGSASSSLGKLASAGTGAWSFASDLALPLFDGGARQAGLDSARIERDMAVAQYRKTVQAAFREVADGLAARGTFNAELDARRSNVAAQRRRLELAEMSYSQGTSDYLGVLTARTDLYNAEIALIAVQQQRLAAMAHLYRALGGGWIERSGDVAPPADLGADIPLAQAQEQARTPE